jgi:hypothetical protein
MDGRTDGRVDGDRQTDDSSGNRETDCVKLFQTRFVVSVYPHKHFNVQDSAHAIRGTKLSR